MSTVVVMPIDNTGNVIGVSKNNPDYGYVRVESLTTQINAEGWLRSVKRSALIKGLVKDLVSAGFTGGQALPGKIVIRESLQPFNANDPERDLKIAGDTGIVCRVDDQPIYRQSFYTTDVNAMDELIMHTNTEEIRSVQKANRVLGGMVSRSFVNAEMAVASGLEQLDAL